VFKVVNPTNKELAANCSNDEKSVLIVGTIKVDSEAATTRRRPGVTGRTFGKPRKSSTTPSTAFESKRQTGWVQEAGRPTVQLPVLSALRGYGQRRFPEGASDRVSQAEGQH